MINRLKKRDEGENKVSFKSCSLLNFWNYLRPQGNSFETKLQNLNHSELTSRCQSKSHQVDEVTSMCRQLPKALWHKQVQPNYDAMH